MRYCLVFLFVIAVGAVDVPSPSLNESWEKFKIKFEKSYKDPDEEVLRRLIWEKSLSFIEKHNVQAARGLHMYTVGENQFSDMTAKEVKQTMNGYRHSYREEHNKVENEAEATSATSFHSGDYDFEFDWRYFDVVTDVKNQKECGSCWAFSTTGAIESAYALAYGKLVSLSEQNIMDCSDCHYYNFACNGGEMTRAFKYVVDNGGIDTEVSYPYQSWYAYLRRDVCEYTEENRGAAISDYVTTTSGSESELLKAVLTKGPVSISMDASLATFHAYSGGIYSDPDCSSATDALDHGILVTGFGRENGQDYWIVKNSWGKFWGEDGYFRIARNADNMCGVATAPVYPVI